MPLFMIVNTCEWFKQLTHDQDHTKYKKILLFIDICLPDMCMCLRLADWLLELPVERYSDPSNLRLHTSETIISYRKKEKLNELM